MNIANPWLSVFVPIINILDIMQIIHPAIVGNTYHLRSVISPLNGAIKIINIGAALKIKPTILDPS